MKEKIKRYDISGEGLGEFNIDPDDDGEYCLYEDVEDLLDANKLFERRFNRLRGEFDLNKRLLDDVIIILEETLRVGHIEQEVEVVLKEALEKQKLAVSRIAEKAGYTER